jgi:hypothetical protein
MEKIDNPGALPNNTSRQNTGINKTMHTATTGKEVESLYKSKSETPDRETLRSIETDKLDPAIGSNCRIEQEQAYIESAEATPTTSPLNSYRDKRSASTDHQEHYDTKQGAKCNGTHKISTHDNDHVEDNENMTRINRHIAASKSSFDSAVATIALIVTTVGIYELSVIKISTAATTSSSPTQPHLPEMDTQLWHVRFNLLDCVLLTALVVATTPTVMSLCLRRYVRLPHSESYLSGLVDPTLAANGSRRQCYNQGISTTHCRTT